MLFLTALRRYQPGDEQAIVPPSPDRLTKLCRLLAFSERIHRYHVEGLEHIPRTGPALIVSPHAFSLLNSFLLAKRVFERDGRLPRGLTHHMVYKIPLLRDLFVTWGIVDGTPANGAALLSTGQLAYCMPGGAREWSRSSFQRRQLRWGDHRGYARLAVQLGVPVIPVTCPAADNLYVVLNDGWKMGLCWQRLLKTSQVYPVPILALGLGPLPLPVRLTDYVERPQWPLRTGCPEESARELDTRVRGLIEQRLRNDS